MQGFQPLENHGNRENENKLFPDLEKSLNLKKKPGKMVVFKN